MEMPEDRGSGVIERLVRLVRNQLVVEQKVQELYDLLRTVCESLNGKLAGVVDGELQVTPDIRVTTSKGIQTFEWELQFRGRELLGFTCQPAADPFWPSLASSCEVREAGRRRVFTTLYLLREGGDAGWHAAEESPGMEGSRRTLKITGEFMLDIFRRYLDTVLARYGGT